MSKKLITIFVITVIGFLLGIIVLESNRTQKLNASMEEVLNSENPIYYYGITCPNCEDVTEFFENNEIEEKITIVKKEVYQNTNNATELTQVAKFCGITTNSIGVPFLFSEGQCLVGSLDIINYLSDKVGLDQDIESTDNIDQDDTTLIQ